MITTMVACSTGSKNTRPPIKFNGTTTTKSVVPEGDIGVANMPTDNFSITDDKVIALTQFENVAGEYTMRWDWFEPNGNLYASSGDYPVKTTDGKYRRTVTLWHTMPINGEKASTLPGKWSVKIFCNNDLVDTKTFMITATAQLVLPENISQTPDPNKWALIIGIEDYARLPKAEYARKDALVVKEYFTRILGVPEKNIILLMDNEATKARIESFIHDYLPANLNKNNQLYVYFAGHGAPEIKKGDAYLVPYDGDTRFLKSTAYPLKEFYANLDKIGNQNTYIFIDACFSGIASRAAEMLAKGTRPALIHVEDTLITNKEADHMVAISSSSAGEPSNAYPDTQHGLFTFFLLKGIGGEADSNSDHKLSIGEIYQYVFKNVSQEARLMGSQQMPMITPSIAKIKDVTIGEVPR
ncbi:MAG: caspase family protein [Desulfobacteraceae bacterium]|nr:caspase family protein [Desulfobacteraceae bacterium]